MPVKIKAAVDKIKAAVDKIKAAPAEQITAGDFEELQEVLEEYQKDEEENVAKIKAAIDKIKATTTETGNRALDEEKQKALVSELNKVINSENFFLLFSFGGAAITTIDESSLNDLRMENAAWERIVGKLELEIDALKQNSK